MLTLKRQLLSDRAAAKRLVAGVRMDAISGHLPRMIESVSSGAGTFSVVGFHEAS
jgi:hypothetical protein